MKLITVTATNRGTGAEDSAEFQFPQTLEEAVEMFGKTEVFTGFIRDYVIKCQAKVRPRNPENGTPKRRRSYVDMLGE